MPVEELTIHAIESSVGDQLRGIDHLLDAALATSTWRELAKAVELGVLEIREMGEATDFGFSREAAVAEYLRLVAELTEPSSRSTPMLDYSAAGVLEIGTSVGALKRPLPDASTEVALASHYLGFLPAFPRADLAAVLNAREQLKGPLTRFRSLMAELSREIELSPTRPEFDGVANGLFRRELTRLRLRPTRRVAG